MTVSIIPINHIFDLFSLQSNRNDTLSPEFIDNQFNSLIKIVANKIFEHDFDSVIDLFNELIICEDQLKNHKSDVFLVNNKDYSKLLLYEVNYLHSRIIDMISDFIQHVYCEYRSILQSDPSSALELKTSCLSITGHFLYYLITIRSFNEDEIDHYIQLLTESIKFFKL